MAKCTLQQWRDHHSEFCDAKLDFELSQEKMDQQIARDNVFLSAERKKVRAHLDNLREIAVDEMTACTNAPTNERTGCQSADADLYVNILIRMMEHLTRPSDFYTQTQRIEELKSFNEFFENWTTKLEVGVACGGTVTLMGGAVGVVMYAKLLAATTFATASAGVGLVVGLLLIGTCGWAVRQRSRRFKKPRLWPPEAKKNGEENISLSDHLKQTAPLLEKIVQNLQAIPGAAPN